MNISRDKLLMMIKEEVASLFKEAEVVDADEDNKEKDKEKSKDKKDSKDSKPKSNSQPSEKPKDKIPQQLKTPVDMPGVSPEEDAAADSNGTGISDELSGMTVMSVTFDQKSKLVPGASELTIQFKESPHPFKVLIGKSGQVKFVYKNAILNDLGNTPAEPEMPSAGIA